jgi:hypothetical protein
MALKIHRNTMKINKQLCLAVAVFSISALFQAGYAATPASQDILRIHTGLPTRPTDSLFSYTVEWRVDQGELFRTTGITFLNATKIDSSATAAVAKKLLIAIKDGMTQMDPISRGITFEQPQDKPELTIANKAGYSFTTVTFRDYSNQPLRFDLGAKSFSAAGVEIGIDLVRTADVEYLDGFKSRHKSETVSKGEIEITIDAQKPILVTYDGKTTHEIEQEISRRLSNSQLSATPLYPGLVSKDTRNNKPFDGSEVQLANLAAQSIFIGIRDPELGVLTKFKFKDQNHSVKVMEPRFMLAALGAASLAVIGAIWYRNKKLKPK